MFIYGPLSRSPLFRSDSRDEATFQDTRIDGKSSLSCKTITTPLRCASRGHDSLPAYMLHPNCSHNTRHAQCQPFRLITTKCDPILQICRELNHQSVAWIGEYVIEQVLNTIVSANERIPVVPPQLPVDILFCLLQCNIHIAIDRL
jgi:hypothetical protein